MAFRSGIFKRLFELVKWVLFASITGVVAGLVGVALVKSISFVGAIREANWWVVLLMPLVGMLIVWLYRICGRDSDSGTNAVLAAVRNKEEIHLRTTVLIWISTVLTQFVGGSAGREGAALQFGGSLGEALGKLFKLDSKAKSVMIMSGMSAAFSAVFGVPLAAIVFPMEVVSVGIMRYSALVPCTIASMVAHEIALLFGVGHEAYLLPTDVSFGLVGYAALALCALLGSVVSILFIRALHYGETLLEKHVQNSYLRIFVGGVVLVVLTMIFGTDYNGLGSAIITEAINLGKATPYAFLLKMVFTIITISVGFRGGEIVPTFFIGATLGATIGAVLGFEPGLCAAFGMIAVFCGATNCPLASLLIACELCGFEYALYFMVIIAITYMVSGSSSLYKTQLRIDDSKGND